MPNMGGWVWVIPFSNGVTSLGLVTDLEGSKRYPENEADCLRALVADEPSLRARLSDTEWVLQPQTIKGYSCAVKKLFGSNFCLVGNATEFLDPVFSSGVTLALESGNRATKCVIRQLRGEQVDWDADYAKPMMMGIDVFRTFVARWYDGTLPTIFFASESDAGMRNKICSVLAGYVWDESNPFVTQHDRKVTQLARFIESRA